MKARSWMYSILELMLLDTIIVTAYCLLAFFGIVFIGIKINNEMAMIVTFCLYITLMVVVYLFVVRKIAKFFENKKEGHD
jgi:hypothetical protein